LNCAKVLNNSVADAHGCFDIHNDKLVECLFPLFSTVLIHYWEKDTETNSKAAELILKHKDKQIIQLQYTSDRKVKELGYM